MASNASKQTLFALSMGLFCAACFGEAFTKPPPGTPSGAGGGTGGQGTGGDAGAGPGGGGGAGGNGGNGGGGPFTCPTGLPGPTMVPIEVPGGGSYCIDSTEVTVGQYRVFYLEVENNLPKQPDFCMMNDNFFPSDFGDPKPDDYPQALIDWCDARGYCEWAGKRLCGRIGGGPLDVGDVSDPQVNEWLHACSAGGEREYPYGDTYDPDACNGLEYPPTDPDLSIPAGAAQECVGGVPGLFDMSGNVAEFIQSCDGARCRAAASKYDSDATEMECGRTFDPLPGERFEYLGFRCCGN